jgi:hypothetical protein
VVAVEGVVPADLAVQVGCEGPRLAFIGGHEHETRRGRQVLGACGRDSNAGKTAGESNGCRE